MPDLFSLAGKRWKTVLLLTLAATLLSLLACLVSPKQYLGVVTALPANSLLADKARLFNQNIQALYTEFGSPDELDRMEGTARLDTIYLAVAKDFQLVKHYGVAAAAKDALEKAALKLKKNSSVSRSGYGELKIKVWDRDNHAAADLANALLQKINAIHQQLQIENNQNILVQLKEDYKAKQQTLNNTRPLPLSDTVLTEVDEKVEEIALRRQLHEYSQMIAEYELALKTAPKALLVVEKARPSPWSDKPATLQIVLFTFLASLLFSFLLVLYVESRCAS